jgi:uncharacterized protein (DUF2147 family)
MKKLYVLAALLMATTAAHAGNSISFEINGNRVHIEVPRNCDSLSCMEITAPGLTGSGFGFKDKSDRDDDKSDNDQPDRFNDKSDRFGDKSDRFNDKPGRFNDRSDRFNDKPNRFNDRSDRFNDKPNRFNGRLNRFSDKSKRFDDNDDAARSDQPAPKPDSGPAASDTAPASTAAASTTSAPAVTNDAPAPAAVATVAPAQTAAAAAPAEAPTTPLGVWATEGNKGNVSVEPCGPNLCGFAVKTGDKILINMKPSDNKWTGRIHDPNSGRDYDSTMAMKGPNAMRVQGCAFGGMFCGGQTWKRVS